MIEVRNLTKRYGAETAVDDLSFEVRPGVVTGFLGPNGSGKSTTMRLLLGLDVPDRGYARIGGRRLSRPRLAAARGRRIAGGAGVSPRAHRPGPTCRARRQQRHRGLAGGRGAGDRRAWRASPAAGPGRSRSAWRQRLGLASALLGDPQVLLLDEPVNGLDPDGIRWIRNLLKELAAQGRTVLVSSHLISEMAITAQNLIVIGGGRLLADTTVAELAVPLRLAGAGVLRTHHGLRRVRRRSVRKGTLMTVMTAALPTRRLPIPQRGRMEWIKLRSLRSTWWTLAFAVAGAVGIGTAVGIKTQGHLRRSDEQRARRRRARPAGDRRARRAGDEQRVQLRPDPLDVDGHPEPAAAAGRQGRRLRWGCAGDR